MTQIGAHPAQRFYRIVIPALIAVLIAVWLARLSHGLYWLSCDDIVRIVAARSWHHKPFFAPRDVFWPPLPFWVYGILMAPRWELSPYVQTIPSLLCVAFAIVIVSRPAQSKHLGAWGPITAFLLLSVPLVINLTTSVLCEPLVLLFTVGALRLVIAPSPCVRLNRSLLLWLCLAAAMLCRYEAWLSGAIIWLFHVLFQIKLDAKATCRERTKIQFLRVAGTAALLLFPALWLYLNNRLNGDWRAPFKTADLKAVSRPPGERFGYVMNSLVLVSPTLTCFSLIGLFAALRRRDWNILVPLVAYAFPFFMMVARDLIGAELPQRFALPVIAALLPLGGEGISQVGRLTTRSRLIALVALIPVAAAGAGILAALVPIPIDYNLELRDELVELRMKTRAGERLVILDPPAPNHPEDEPLIKAAFPSDSIVDTKWLKPIAPISQEMTKKLNIRWILFRNNSSLALFANPPLTYRPLGNGWRVFVPSP